MKEQGFELGLKLQRESLEMPLQARQLRFGAPWLPRAGRPPGPSLDSLPGAFPRALRPYRLPGNLSDPQLGVLTPTPSRGFVVSVKLDPPRTCRAASALSTVS